MIPHKTDDVDNAIEGANLAGSAKTAATSARTPTPYGHYLMNPKMYLVRKKLPPHAAHDLLYGLCIQIISNHELLVVLETRKREEKKT